MDDKVSLGIIELIRCERFYAELLMRFKKVPDPKASSISVRLDVSGVTLSYNPAFMNQFSLEPEHMKAGIGIGEIASVLKHECEHIMRGHLDWRRRELEPDLFNEEKTKNETIFDYLNNSDTVRLLNIAEDLEINETIPKLPSTFFAYDEKGEVVMDKEGNPVICRPCRVKDLQAAYPNMKIENNQTMEYYYNILKKIKEQNQQPNKNKDGSIMMPIDDHGENGDNDDDGNGGKLDPEMAREIARQLVNEAYESLSSADKGKMPGHLMKLIEELNQKTKDWRKDIRQFRESCAAVIIEETKRRRNRRYGLLYPGRRMKPKLHIVIAKDTSGSVYDEALNQFDSEILAMSKLGIKITIIDCDLQIRQVYEYEQKFRKANMGRGGTAFGPVFDLVKTKAFQKEWGKPDGLIYFTDGEDCGDVQKPNFKVLWALMPNCKSRYEWGNKTHIEINQKRRK